MDFSEAKEFMGQKDCVHFLIQLFGAPNLLKRKWSYEEGIILVAAIYSFLGINRKRELLQNVAKILDLDIGELRIGIFNERTLRRINGGNRWPSREMQSQLAPIWSEIQSEPVKVLKSALEFSLAR